MACARHNETSQTIRKVLHARQIERKGLEMVTITDGQTDVSNGDTGLNMITKTQPSVYDVNERPIRSCAVTCLKLIG